MYSLQVLRVWYRNRSLRALRPEARTPGSGPDVLTVISPDRDIIDINTRTLYARSASGREPDYEVCERAIRAYSTGLAASRETDAAVSILLHMPEVSPGLASVHQRMAAMFLFSEGRDAEGKAIADSAIALPRGVALEDLGAVLSEQPPGKLYDDVALRAFGVDPNDPGAIRHLMKWFADNRYVETALRFANRMQTLSPGDEQASEVMREMNALLEKRKKLLPAAAGVD